jgi:uncharacterized membrane protein
MGRLSASHTVEIEAPLERVYEVAADVPNSHVWQPSLESVEVIETDAEGRAELVAMEADALVKKTHQTMRFSYVGAPNGLSWVQEKGDVKELEGSWALTELGADRTRATFALAIDPGRMLGMLLRGPVEGKVKEHLTKGAAEGLKRHIESGA